MTLQELKNTLELYSESKKNIKNLVKKYNEIQKDMYSIKGVSYDRERAKTNDIKDVNTQYLIKLEDIKNDIMQERIERLNHLENNIKIIDRLPGNGNEHETMKLILELKYIDCYTVEEITEFMDLSRSRVFDYLKKGLKMLLE